MLPAHGCSHETRLFRSMDKLLPLVLLDIRKVLNENLQCRTAELFTGSTVWLPGTKQYVSHLKKAQFRNFMLYLYVQPSQVWCILDCTHVDHTQLDSPLPLNIIKPIMGKSSCTCTLLNLKHADIGVHVYDIK